MFTSRTLAGAPGRRYRLRVEPLESRTAPSASPACAPDEYHPVLVAGDPNGSPADSPAARVDPNTASSAFAGVGSIQVNVRRGTYIGSGTLIDATHVVTAGHVVDINNDGKTNFKDGIQSIYLILNAGGGQQTIAVSQIAVHPDFTGFSHPSVNDDIAVLTLASAVSGVPTYTLPTSDLAAGTTVTMVGYGRSGDGVSGYTTTASFSVKRTGENNADVFEGQDDPGRDPADEVFLFDFDGPSGNGSLGGGTLGNDRETTLGGGDSGGPSFVPNGSGYTLVGVNTFTQGFDAPFFGSLGGGINVYPYVGWIESVLSGSTGPSDPPSKPHGKGGGQAATLLMDAAAVTVAWSAPADAAPVPPAAPVSATEPEATDKVADTGFLGGVLAEPAPVTTAAVPARESGGSELAADELLLTIPV
ncbi:MAG TPA: S1 family peptidase [Fimbriiglobus sp.]|nr:S1 family peptidase [Fimbriiglobus sp.]